MEHGKKGIITKSFANSYLYNKNNSNYESTLFNFIMTSERIDKTSDAFAEVIYDIKRRQITTALTKVLQSSKVVLCIGQIPLPKAFKVFTSKDVKTGNALTVFIDCSDLIRFKDGKYIIKDIDILVAYLVSAMTQIIYYNEPKMLVMRNEIIVNGAACFSTLFTYIIDYLYKITSVASTRNKCLYLSSIYYQHTILCKDITDSAKSIAREISGLSQREEEILWIQVKDEMFLNINYFVNGLNVILKLTKLDISVVLEKWIYLYGTGTQFALELYPAFASLLTNAYVGCYINNQKTIEKITGKDMIPFTTSILKIGADAV